MSLIELHRISFYVLSWFMYVMRPLCFLFCSSHIKILLSQNCSGCVIIFFSFWAEKENGPRTVKDVKLISAGKILENNKTLGECQSPLCDIPGGVTTMHVVVQPPPLEKGTSIICEISKLIIWCFSWRAIILVCPSVCLW